MYIFTGLLCLVVKRFLYVYLFTLLQVINNTFLRLILKNRVFDRLYVRTYVREFNYFNSTVRGRIYDDF